MVVELRNAQRTLPVPRALLLRVAQAALKYLRIHTPGCLSVTLISAHQMRLLNRCFTGHRGLTDVLSFRYDGEPIVGEILIAPQAARSYAKRHGLSYHTELSRYVVHGLLHWLGYEDTTKAQQEAMRRREDRLLIQCNKLDFCKMNLAR